MPKPSSPLLIGLAVVILGGALLFAVVRRRPVVLSERLGVVPGRSRPRVVTGFAGATPLVAWAGQDGLWLRPLVPGGSPPAFKIPGLESVKAIVPLADGAILFEEGRFTRLGPDGGPVGGIVSLAEHPAGINRAYALGGDVIAAVVVERATRSLHFRLHRLDGSAAGPDVLIPGGELSSEVGLVRLPRGQHILAWLEGAESKRLMLSTVDADGKSATTPRAAHDVPPEGSAGLCTAGPSSDGNALVVWRDSSPGPFAIFSLKAGASGPLGAATRISPDSKDASNPSVLLDGGRSFVAWGSGIHFGVLAVSGRGAISLLSMDGRMPFVYYAPGSIESHGVAVAGGRLVLAGAVHEGDQHVIYGNVIAAP